VNQQSGIPDHPFANGNWLVVDRSAGGVTMQPLGDKHAQPFRMLMSKSPSASSTCRESLPVKDPNPPPNS